MAEVCNLSGKHASTFPSVIEHLCQSILRPTPQQLPLWIWLCRACSTATVLAHACNIIGTWRGLLFPPGKRLMCSQTLLGFTCHLGQQRLRSAPRNSWQEQSLDPELCDAPVSKSSWVWSASKPGTGLSACMHAHV